MGRPGEVPVDEDHDHAVAAQLVDHPGGGRAVVREQHHRLSRAGRDGAQNLLLVGGAPRLRDPELVAQRRGLVGESREHLGVVLPIRRSGLT